MNKGRAVRHWHVWQVFAEDGDADIAWNFTKFLVDGDGEVVARYEPQVAPQEVGADAAKRLAGG